MTPYAPYPLRDSSEQFRLTMLQAGYVKCLGWPHTALDLPSSSSSSWLLHFDRHNQSVHASV